jgi:hypothetical protein
MLRVSRWVGPLAIAVALFAASAASAQRGRALMGPLPPPILSKLNLSSEQQAKIKVATDAYLADLKRAAGIKNPQSQNEAAKRSEGAYQVALKDALNADQQKQLQTMLEEARDFGPLWLPLASLDLTPDQKGKIREVVGKHQPEIEKLDSMRKRGADNSAIDAQVEEQYKKMLEEVKATLTPDQLKQFTVPEAPKKSR